MTAQVLKNPASIIAQGGEGLQMEPTRQLLNWVVEELKRIRQSLGASTGGAGAGMLCGSVTADVASIAAGAEGSQNVTVTGAAVGDFVLASIVDTPASGSLDDAFLNARVSAADTVKINITNTHAATALDLSAGAVFRILVIPKAAVLSSNGAALAAMSLTSQSNQ